MSRVRTISTTALYSGAISLRMDRFSLNGRVIDKEIVQHQPSVGVVPVVDQKSVLLVTQYRRAAGKTLLEIPAGKIEKGETPKQAAARELAEETGHGGKLEPLTKWFLAPGYDTELMHVFIATNLHKVNRGLLDDDEDIAIEKISLERAVEKCFRGEIEDCKTVAALMAYKLLSDRDGF